MTAPTVQRETQEEWVDAEHLLGVPGYLTRNRLVLPDGARYEEWCRVGMVLRFMEEGVHWWIGDWWRYGERHYGDMASQQAQDSVEDMTGYAYKTVVNDAWVASRFEPSRRRENLSFSHHAEAAALEPETADSLLDRAESEGWDRRTMRENVRRARKDEEPEGDGIRRLRELHAFIQSADPVLLARSLQESGDKAAGRAYAVHIEEWAERLQRELERDYDQ